MNYQLEEPNEDPAGGFSSADHSDDQTDNANSTKDFARLLGEHGIELPPVTKEEMLPYLTDAFYRRLSRRELRDLIWATHSATYSPFAVLVVLVDAASSTTNENAQMTRTFIARMDEDLADFCDCVVEIVTTQMIEVNVEVNSDKVAKDHADDPPEIQNGRNSRGGVEDGEDSSQVDAEDRVHLIYSDHSYCLWKPCVYVLESLLRGRGRRVTQHRFSGIWHKSVKAVLT